MAISAGSEARGLTASLEGQTLSRWITAKIPGVVVPVVLTDGAAGDQPGIYYDLVEGNEVLISQIFFGVTTVADLCDFEIGYTDAAGGAGTFQPLDLARRVATVAVGDGLKTFGVTFNPPLRILKYSDGVRSVTFRVTCGAVGTEILAGWRGWLEIV
jgi:hypothetical protein